MNFCKTKNINLLVIPFWEYNRTEEIIDLFLADKEIVFRDPPSAIRKYVDIRNEILNS